MFGIHNRALVTDQPEHAVRGSCLSALSIHGNPGSRTVMTVKEEEMVAPKGSLSADGTAGMDWFMPKGLQQMISACGKSGEAVPCAG